MCADHLKKGISPKARTGNQPALYCRALILLRPPLYSHVLRSIGWKPTTQRTGTHNVALHLKAASRETKGPKHVPSWIRTRLARLRLPSRKRQAQHRFARCSAHGSATCSPSLILHSPLQPRLVQDTVAAAPAADRIVAPKVGRRPAAAAPGKRTRVGSVTRRYSLGLEEGGEGGLMRRRIVERVGA